MRPIALILLAIALLPLFFLDGIHGEAFLQEGSHLHYLMAAFSAAAFLALLRIGFPKSSISAAKLIGYGVFVGTVGILLLLGFQWMANRSLSYEVSGGDAKWALTVYAVKIIGFSYSCLGDPTAGPLLKFLGYTIGVGICEECCKALPVLTSLKDHSIDNWQDACLIGLACGIGFGISEGIHYSTTLYNGHANAGAYLIRFTSLAALHALWTGGAALFMYRNRHNLDNVRSRVKVLWLPVVGHGLYDTLICQESHRFAGLMVAGMSFIVFAVLVKRSRSLA